MLKLALYFHNHQPVGNFEEVFEHAYQHSYKPLLQSLLGHPAVKFGIHNSGPLCDWIEQRHPEYFEMLREAVKNNQAEILSSAYSEPILSLIPRHDLVDQIRYFNDYLFKKFEFVPKGLWLTERVWEPSLISVLLDAGIEYTLLDDTHFRYAGLTDDELITSFITEDEGRILKVFPISMKLRYLIPFHPIDETIEFLKEESAKHLDCLKCLGDDGEKFGVWPGTYQWVFGHNWLNDFLSRLTNETWINTVHLAEVARNPSAGRIYLPTASYEEMGEWVLPNRAGHDYHELKKSVDKKYFYLVHGGYFKNFLAKYPEANLMHKRMLYVSKNVNNDPAAKRFLWRGQCSCAYWHGIFGGLYLPHLRDGIYKNLIEADTISVREELTAADFDADGSSEIIVSTQKFFCVIKPKSASFIEIDDRNRKMNLLNYLGRRKENYHGNLLAAESGDEVKSIHEIVRSKDKDLARLLIYDKYDRGFAIDHVLSGAPTVQDFYLQGAIMQTIHNYDQYDFVGGTDPVVKFTSSVLEKTIRVAKDQPLIEISYKGGIDKLGIELSLGVFHRGLKINGRYSIYDFQTIDNLTEAIVSAEDFEPVTLSASVPFTLLSYPIETVSSSESGFEKNFQGFSFLMIFSTAPSIKVRL